MSHHSLPEDRAGSTILNCHPYSARICHVDRPITSIGLTALAKSASPRTPSSIRTERESRLSTYTSFSGRSFASSFTSPAQQETINSVQSPSQHKVSFHASGNRQSYTKSRHLSLADQIDNWRLRAQLNGIEVASDGDEPHEYGRENQYRSPITPPKVPTCFYTPPPRRNANGIYTRGAYTAPPRFPFHASPMKQTSCLIPDNPINNIQEQMLLSPLRERDILTKSPASNNHTFNKLDTLFSKGLSSPAYTRSFSGNPSTLAPSPFDAAAESSCTVCDKQPSQSCRMIVLSPCSHILCSSCFTGTLNIVGEKSMSCMKCNSPVENFHFALAPAVAGSCSNRCPANKLAFQLTDITTSSKVIPGNFAVSLQNQKSKEKSLKTGEISVLRIDNIPWDVTPAVLEEFFKLPLCSTHILLDLKGKTLSHAFVRLTAADARVALRSTQNAILGTGRRARAVTVTLTSLDELMMAIYPRWKGTFKNGVPSLDGLDKERVKGALSHGLVSKEELNALRELILNPNSPFLKVPRLPFSSLINILITFPSDMDSQMFWNLDIRNMLYDVTKVALKKASEQVAIREINTGLNLLLELGNALASCQIFTDLQKLILLQVINDFVRCGQLDL